MRTHAPGAPQPRENITAARRVSAWPLRQVRAALYSPQPPGCFLQRGHPNFCALPGSWCGGVGWAGLPRHEGVRLVARFKVCCGMLTVLADGVVARRIEEVPLIISTEIERLNN